MAVNLEGGAPYAPSTSIMEFLTRNRAGTLPAPVTLQTLERLGIPESLRPRVIQALKLLDFIDNDGNLSPEMEQLRKAPTPEYLPKLADMLRATYADVFAVIDPSGASYEQVTDAFRGFKPAGQMSRMVTLFLGLLEHTGQWHDLPSPRSGSGQPAVRTPRKSPGEKARNASNGRKPAEPPPPPPVSPTTKRQEPYSQTVQLAGQAGTVTLSVDVNPIKLKGAAREFFYSLVDMMDNYQDTTSGSQG